MRIKKALVYKYKQKWQNMLNSDDDYYDRMYDEDWRDAPFTCTMAELTTPSSEENLAFAILSATNNGYRALFVNVTAGSKAAQRILEKFGFVKTLSYRGGHQQNIYHYVGNAVSLVR